MVSPNSPLCQELFSVIPDIESTNEFNWKNILGQKFSLFRNVIFFREFHLNMPFCQDEHCLKIFLALLLYVFKARASVSKIHFGVRQGNQRDLKTGAPNIYI